MNRNILTLALLICIATLAQAKNKPNLVIIHTDEHNFRTLSCYRDHLPEKEAYVWGKGNGVKTPNIDRIADEGAICMNYYASTPVCSPSRASMITGLYRQATDVYKNNDNLRKDIPTLATILNENGYATSYVGKWHLEESEKYKFNVSYPAGFTDHRYMMTRGHSPYFHLTPEGIKSLNQNQIKNLPEKDVIHMTDYFAEKTIEILERDKDKPFALIVSIPDPHTPDYAREPYGSMYKDLNLKMPETMLPELIAKKPNWGKGDKNEAKGFKPEALKQYFGMVKHIDDKVGDILTFLDKNNLRENTIIIFTSDHGDLFYEHNRMNKGNAYEASSKIPFVIRYPEKIKPGKVIEKAYCNVNLVPTLLGLMDVHCDAKFHGKNTAKDFTNKKERVIGDDITHMSGSGESWIAAVSSKYKLVISKTDKPWMFDLDKDPHEIVNVYNQPGYEKASKRMLNALKKRMKKFNEPVLDPKYGMRYQ